MKIRRYLLPILVCLLTAGCASPLGSDPYALISAGGAGKQTEAGTFYLQIVRTEPLIKFGPDGLNNRRTTELYLYILEGPGPVFRNPRRLGENPGRHPVTHGTVRLDKVNNRVTIDLTLSYGTSAEATPDPANGTYTIKRWDYEASHAPVGCYSRKLTNPFLSLGRMNYDA